MNDTQVRAMRDLWEAVTAPTVRTIGGDVVTIISGPAGYEGVRVVWVRDADGREYPITQGQIAAIR